MGKRILVTSTDLMMIQFLVPHVRYLSENGFDVEVACSDVGGRMDEVRTALDGAAKAIHTVRLHRSPAAAENLKGYGDMKRDIASGNYDIIWANEPVMGVVTRLAARKSGAKVVYMCHGFHFFKGSGKGSWLVFYPVERFCSRFTDVLVTINREDEARAKTFHAGRVAYIHGIGVNTDRLHRRDIRSNIRAELGLAEDDFLVLSVGELNKNKNHQVIIRAVAQLNDPKIHYAICGKGALMEQLQKLAKELGIESHVHFLGYRKDVVDICSQADVFAHASLREGLSVASLEAMYCGLPLVMSTVRGAGDYLKDGVSGFLLNPHDADGYAKALRKLCDDPAFRDGCGKHNVDAVEPYTLENVQQEILDLFSRLCS